MGYTGEGKSGARKWRRRSQVADGASEKWFIVSPFVTPVETTLVFISAHENDISVEHWFDPVVDKVSLRENNGKWTRQFRTSCDTKSKLYAVCVLSNAAVSKIRRSRSTGKSIDMVVTRQARVGLLPLSFAAIFARTTIVDINATKMLSVNVRRRRSSLEPKS